MSFLFGTFQGLIAPFRLFHTPIAVHAAFSVGTSPGIHKTQPFAGFGENSDISFLIAAFRSLPLFSLHLARRT
jgi:hypothetical protein